MNQTFYLNLRDFIKIPLPLLQQWAKDLMKWDNQCQIKSEVINQVKFCINQRILKV